MVVVTVINIAGKTQSSFQGDFSAYTIDP